MKKLVLSQMLSVLLLFALLVSGCGPATPEEAQEPTSGVGPSAGETSTIPVDDAAPTDTPAPTATPLPMPPPRLLYRSPAPGEEQPLDAPIELTFDQPMDRASVEASFAISPTIEGVLDWSDDRTVSYVPSLHEDAGLQRGIRYRVTLASTARNIEGESLAEPVVFDFSAVGYLSVSDVMPSPGTIELDPNTVVTVVFDRPVVPLVALGSQGQLPKPLTFVPATQGTGEWLNTSIYQFRPDDGFLPATLYKARVAAGLTDTTGGVLEEDYTWEFSTVRPAILQVRPRSDFAYVGPTDVISVTFNQPMDHESVQYRFSLEAEGNPADIEGVFRWSGGESPTAPETMTFVPAEPFPRDTRFIARVEYGALASEGSMGTERTRGWSFRTVREPGLVRTSPVDGAEKVEPDGSLRLIFASPMERQGFLDHLSISPQVTNVYSYWSTYDTEVSLYFKRDPATSYTVSVAAQTPDKHGATLGKRTRVRFTTGDLSPIAWLNTDNRLVAFGAYTDTVVYATHRNVSKLDVELFTLDPEQFLELNSSWSAWDRFAARESDLVKRWSIVVDAPRNETRLARIDLTNDEGKPLASGLYYLQLTAPEVRKPAGYTPPRAMFVKSGVNLVLKQTETEALVWATDLRTGQPIADLAVALFGERGQSLAEGTTAGEGFVLLQGLEFDSLWDALLAVSGEPGEDHFAVAYNGWDEGISPWSFDLPSEFWDPDFQGYLYTERPIYRPGQMVYFKGIVRADDDAHYRLPNDPDLPGGPIQTLQVSVHDPQGKELYKEELALNDMGTLFDELQLDAEAPLGTYYIEVSEPERELYIAGTSFRVAEYRKPEFQVSAAADRKAYLDGDTINIATEGTYYFGGPVSEAGVHWSVLSTGYSFTYQCPQGQSCPWYSWSDFEWDGYGDEVYYDSYGKLVAEGNTRTDDQGQVTFNVQADIGGETQSQAFTIEASVTDLNGQQVSSRTAVIVHKGEFYVGVAPQGYLAQVGEQKAVDLLVVDWDSEPVADVPLTVTFMEHRWYSVRRQSEDGYFYWDWSTEDIPVYTTTVTSGDLGQAVAEFVPRKAGSYKVRASAVDGRGNEVRSAGYFWVWGGDGYVSWRQESTNRIELIADKQEYKVGDVAEILIPSPYSGTVQALVTIERGHIMQTDVLELKSNSEVLRVPITEDLVPDVFVSVVIVQGAEQAPHGLAGFKMGVVELPISVASKELDITLIPDKDMEAGEFYGPRQSVTYDVLVTDYQGEPVEAELSLRLADVAVLALADEPGPTLLETYWRSRGLGVRTSTPLVVAMEAYNREIAPEAKGGGGGDEGGLLRTEFADTAFWDPVVRTGRDGKAQVTVALPDNLTTWRMQVRGITADTRVGRAEVDILSTLELLVRPVLPRFFVVGDEAEIATVVHNNTAEPLDAQVSITTEGLALAGESSQAVSIPPGDKARVVWPVKVLPGDEAKVRMWANAGERYDGREDTMPVYRYATPEVVATAGRLSEPGFRQEIVQLPRVYDPTQGELAVQIDGSLTAATRDALDYLEHYPYECVEQTVSRFLPNVVTWQVLEEMGLERPELSQPLAQSVGVGLQRLYAQQHYDGGWGWWISDKSDPYLTAYVLQGLLEAYRAGFIVDEEVIAKAADYVSDELPSVSQVDTYWEANRLAYELYALAEYQTTFETKGAGELGTAIRLFESRHLLGRYGQATLAVALSLLEPDEPARAQTLLSDLAGSVVASATGMHWEEGKPDYWNMNTNIRTTAVVIWAFSRFEPESELLPNAVRWLMAVRKEGYWETTQATAWSLLGLVEYMRASGELGGEFNFSVYLNGEEMASGEVSRDNIDESWRLEVEIAQLLVDEGNRLVVERLAPGPDQTGEGQLYYSAHLRYYLPVEQVTALDRGILIARQYSPVEEPGQYTDQADVGDVIQVKLSIIAPTDLYYVVVEDPLPAGFEGVDLSLKTTSVVGERPELRNLSAEEESRWFRWYGWGWWWFSHSEMRDEKVALFAKYLPRGTYEYTYLIRASVPGEFLVMPATAYLMYYPEVFGRSDGAKFVVGRAD